MNTVLGPDVAALQVETAALQMIVAATEARVASLQQSVIDLNNRVAAIEAEKWAFSPQWCYLLTQGT